MGTGEHFKTIVLGEDQWAQRFIVEDWSSTDGREEDGSPSLRARILDLHVLSAGRTVRETMTSYAESLRLLADLIDKYTPKDDE